MPSSCLSPRSTEAWCQYNFKKEQRARLCLALRTTYKALPTIRSPRSHGRRLPDEKLTKANEQSPSSPVHRQPVCWVQASFHMGPRLHGVGLLWEPETLWSQHSTKGITSFQPDGTTFDSDTQKTLEASAELECPLLWKLLVT